MRLSFVALVISLVHSPALAQSRPTLDALIDRWAADNDVYVTKRVREEAIAEMVRPASPECRAVDVTPQNSDGSITKRKEQNCQEVTKAITAAPGETYEQTRFKGFWAGSIERYSTIRLSVQPAPPRDYTVAINGEDCQAIESGVYKVPNGPVEVRVVRPGKTPCRWSGRVTDGRTQEVVCNF
jgi:hypothetical protein